MNDFFYEKEQTDFKFCVNFKSNMFWEYTYAFKIFIQR